MKTGRYSVISILFATLACVFFTNTVQAQDATVVDSAHYKVEFENDQVRVLRITYGPGEKSVMHEHPDAVAVFLNDQRVKFTLPDEQTQEVTSKAGQAIWTPAGKHLPENIGDEPLELILVEMKAKGEMIEKK
jgi:quercetin dioxygenase-like cupin family protein